MQRLRGLRRRLANIISPTEAGWANEFARAFYSTVGGIFTSYDAQGKTYVEQGYLKNSAIFSIIQQRYQKVRSIPYFIKRISDEGSRVGAEKILKASRGDMDPAQLNRYRLLEKAAYAETLLGMPLERPNPLQSWDDLWMMYEMFISLNGNVYFYLLRSGVGRDEPVHVYILPSHQVTIVLKDGIELMGADNPIHSYMLNDGHQYAEFFVNEVIHIRTPNPVYDQNGSHLYGQSPLLAVLRNMNSFNEAVDNNVKMMQNSGIFGLIHGKGNRALTLAQADQLKERLTQMDTDTDRLGQITGVSAEVGFTRIGMTPDELKTWSFLNFDEKQIANALGWDTRLLNQDSGATFDNLKIAEKRVVVNTTKPSLDMLSEAINSQFLPLFKGYSGTVLVFDYTELPEMQVNMKDLVEWLSMSLDRGVLSRDEFRQAIGYPITGEDIMEMHTVSQYLEPLEEAVTASFAIDNVPRDPVVDPDQSLMS
ncbi:MAG TPA: phage portal protein [Desulfosporosinus sp.]|nr:phage portal protein [Desulfosporosinus sp.]